MKKIILLSMMCVLILNCASSTIYLSKYDISLVNVERPENAENRYGESELKHLYRGDKLMYQFSDEMINIICIPSDNMFLFSILNKTDHSIKLIWDEAVFVDIRGYSSKLANEEMSRINMNDSHLPSVIVKGTIFETIVFPVSNVSSNNISSIISKDEWTTPKAAKIDGEKYLGNKLQILLPLQIEETINEYIFTFEVKNFSVYKRTWNYHTGRADVIKVSN